MHEPTEIMSRPRVSPEQLNQLICFMEEHPKLAIGRDRYIDSDSGQKSGSVNVRFSSGKLWQAISEKLNSIPGGVTRSADKWCRYWADLKYKAKKRAQTLHGGETLSEVEERIIRLVGAETKSYSTRRDAAMSDEEETKPVFNEDSLESTVNPIEQVNLTQGFDQKLSTEEILAEAAMRSALAAEKQAEAVVQGVELLREFMTTFRQDVTNLQNIAQSILERDSRT